MAEPIPTRIEPDNIPDGWRDDSLHREAIWLNRDDTIPVIFPQDSLKYLRDLGCTLPRRGISFVTAAREFIAQLAIGSLSDAHSADVAELRTLLRRKEEAVASRDFDTVVAIGEQQREVQARIGAIGIHEITIDEIKAALVRVGVDPDDKTVDAV
jgi:hypothetical protein